MSAPLKSFCGVLANIHPGKCNTWEWADIRAKSSEIQNNCTAESFANHLVSLIQTFGHITPGSCNCSEWHSICNKCNQLLTQFSNRDTHATFKDLLLHCTTIYPGSCNCSEWSTIRSTATSTLASLALVTQQKKDNEIKKKMEQQQKKLKSSLLQQRDQLNTRKSEIIENELNPILQRMQQLNLEINAEEKEISQFRLERSDKNKKIAVFVGKTGHGKSTLINRLYGDKSEDADHGPCETSDSAESCTQSLQKVNCDNLCVIDCPGWADSGGADRKHGNMLCKFLKGCGGVNGFVLVRNAQEIRFDADFREKLLHLRYIFGDNDEFWKYLVVVLTHVDQGVAERKFKKGDKAKEMQQQLAKLCQNGNVMVPVIPIGLDNYEDKLKLIKDVISKNRFVSDTIKSPIEDLRKDKQELMGKQNEIQQRIDNVQQEIVNIDSQIHKL